MSEINKQRVCIKFCLKLGENATETYTMIKTAFGEYSLSRSVTFEWYKRFKDGRQSTDDDSRSGRPSTSRKDDVVEKIKEKVRNERRLTVRELANEAGISIGSCHEILTENLQMKRVAAKFVPRLLTLEQKENRLTICQDLKNRCADVNLIKNIITGDETWVYGYDPETKFQSSQWKTKFSPRPKKARQVRSNVKTMLIVFFDIEGIIYYEFVPHGQTVNQVFYKDVLIRLRERIRKKRQEKWRNGTWFLHHDNAPAHSAPSIREFLADKKIPVVPHPLYSPDLAPCDFFLFPRLKSALKGQRFQDVEEIKANTAAELKAITLEQFQRTFQNWQDRWDHCISSRGEYFEDCVTKKIRENDSSDDDHENYSDITSNLDYINTSSDDIDDCESEDAIDEASDITSVPTSIQSVKIVKQVPGPNDISQTLDDGPKQPRLVCYPKIKFGKRIRHFSSKWFDSYNWLEYSIIDNSAFCFPCRFFARNKDKPIFISVGFKNWKNQNSGLRKHNNSEEHMISNTMWMSYLDMKTLGNLSVASLINEGHKKLVLENQNYIKMIGRTLLYTAIQGIAQRGDNEEESCANRGNFIELLNLIGDISNEFKSKSKTLPNNAKYTSPQIQNEMFSIFNKMIRNKIIDELQKCQYFSIIVDETKDITKVEQLSVILRYYLDGVVYERFMGFKAAQSLTASSLFQYIKEILSVHTEMRCSNLRWCQCHEWKE
ncbi:hypothetical protein QTP88_021004 [Uroleucon formosanum]